VVGKRYSRKTGVELPFFEQHFGFLENVHFQRPTNTILSVRKDCVAVNVYLPLGLSRPATLLDRAVTITVTVPSHEAIIL
jgi:hypothetical protein